MEVDLYKIDGTISGEKVQLADAIFNIEPNDHAIYQAVRAQMTRSRQGTAATKNRAAVSGGGRKPWRQKGRGTARAGSIRSPLWVGGGRVFGPVPRKYQFKLPKKVKRLARCSALSYQAKNGALMVVEDFTLKKPLTKEMYTLLQQMNLDSKKILLLVPQYDENILRAGRNIPNLIIRVAETASTYDLLNCQVLLIQKSAIEKIQQVLQS
ncbi:MAG: 50S ribosomal protein L4 [candidate division KSB1 bacterium]|nr:50S ribosomal protein L4 [candidate division KSB1 bacterium]